MYLIGAALAAAAVYKVMARTNRRIYEEWVKERQRRLQLESEVMQLTRELAQVPDSPTAWL